MNRSDYIEGRYNRPKFKLDYSFRPNRKFKLISMPEGMWMNKPRLGGLWTMSYVPSSIDGNGSYWALDDGEGFACIIQSDKLEKHWIPHNEQA